MSTAMMPTFNASSGSPRDNEAGRPPPAGRVIGGAWDAAFPLPADADALAAESVETPSEVVADGLAAGFPGPRPAGRPPLVLTIAWLTGESETP